MLRNVGIAVVSVVMCSLGRAAVPEIPRLTVNVYNDAGVPDEVVKEAERIAGTIYRKAGLEIEWRGPGDPDLDRALFSVRILPHSLNLRGEQFGIAFVGDDGLGVQADVFYSGIESMARTNVLGSAAILGHVMAHELGHLLLGPDSHSRAGIMKARWTRDHLGQMSMGTLVFDRLEADAMRSRLLGPYTTLRNRTINDAVASVTKVFLPQPEPQFRSLP